jgi:hypothetical protein
MLWSCRIQLPVRRGRSAGSGIAGPDPVGMPLPVAVATATRPPVQVLQLTATAVGASVRGRSERYRPSTGRWRTCRSIAAGRRDCRLVGPPSDPEVPSGKPPGVSGFG